MSLAAVILRDQQIVSRGLGKVLLRMKKLDQIESREAREVAEVECDMESDQFGTSVEILSRLRRSLPVSGGAASRGLVERRG